MKSMISESCVTMAFSIASKHKYIPETRVNVDFMPVSHIQTGGPIFLFFWTKV